MLDFEDPDVMRARAGTTRLLNTLYDTLSGDDLHDCEAVRTARQQVARIAQSYSDTVVTWPYQRDLVEGWQRRVDALLAERHLGCACLNDRVSAYTGQDASRRRRRRWKDRLRWWAGYVLPL